MARITQVTPTADGSAVRIDMTGGIHLTVPYKVYLSYGLFPERELDDVDLTTLARECQREAAKEKALQMIRYGDRSQRECRSKLTRIFPPDVVDDVITELVRLELLNDHRFVQRTMEQAEHRGWGKKKLIFELHRRGIDHQEVDRACEQYSEENELQNAIAWLKRQISDKQVDDEAVQRRLFGSLLRRGFGYSTAQAALRVIMGNLSIDDAEES